jgi:hypothetical protein
MHLTWRDLVTTALVVFIGVVFYGWATEVDFALINEIQGTLMVIGLAGLLMWVVGASDEDLGRNWFTGSQGLLAIAAVAFFVVGMITLEPWTVAVLGIDLAVMWAIDLVHRAFVAPEHQQSHA